MVVVVGGGGGGTPGGSPGGTPHDGGGSDSSDSNEDPYRREKRLMRVKHFKCEFNCIVWFAKWLKAMKPRYSIGSVNVTLPRKKPRREPMTFQRWIVFLAPSV